MASYFVTCTLLCYLSQLNFKRHSSSAQQDVICISSESSDDERGKIIGRPMTSDLICISSGSDSSSDDIIFAGTDDHEIAEEEPDVNNRCLWC